MIIFLRSNRQPDQSSLQVDIECVCTFLPEERRFSEKSSHIFYTGNYNCIIYSIPTCGSVCHYDTPNRKSAFNITDQLTIDVRLIFKLSNFVYLFKKSPDLPPEVMKNLNNLPKFQSLTEKFAYIYKTECEDLTDLELTFECGRKIREHSLILGVSSKFFRDLIYIGGEKRNKIFVDWIDYETFRLLASIWYLQIFNVNDRLPSLIMSTRDIGYDLPWNLIFAALINIKCSLKLLTIANTLREKAAMEICLKFIDAHADQVLGSPYFLQLSSPLVSKILSRDSLKIEEIKAFKYLIEWAKFQIKIEGDENPDAMRNLLKVPIANIRFGDIRHQDFAQIQEDEEPLFHDCAQSVHNFYLRIDSKSKREKFRFSTNSRTACRYDDEYFDNILCNPPPYRQLITSPITPVTPQPTSSIPTTNVADSFKNSSSNHRPPTIDHRPSVPTIIQPHNQVINCSSDSNHYQLTLPNNPDQQANAAGTPVLEQTLRHTIQNVQAFQSRQQQQNHLHQQQPPVPQPQNPQLLQHLQQQQQSHQQKRRQYSQQQSQPQPPPQQQVIATNFIPNANSAGHVRTNGNPSQPNANFAALPPNIQQQFLRERQQIQLQQQQQLQLQQPPLQPPQLPQPISNHVPMMIQNESLQIQHMQQMTQNIANMNQATHLVHSQSMNSHSQRTNPYPLPIHASHPQQIQMTRPT